MSNAVFPSALAGLTWDTKKSPVFNNITHSPVTGRDIHIALYNQPAYEFTLTNEFMTKVDRDTLLGFFLQRRGAFDTFLYADEDSAATAYQFGTGDGTTLAFQLSKATGGFVETVNNPVGVPAIYKNDALQSAGYAIDANGLVTFTVAPDAAETLKWTGSAYYRCVFMEDTQEYNQFMSRLYECSEIKFKGSLVNKL